MARSDKNKKIYYLKISKLKLLWEHTANQGYWLQKWTSLVFTTKFDYRCIKNY